jgi:hypothetical protein
VVEEVAHDHLCPEGFQLRRPLVHAADEGAHRNLPRQQHFGNAPPGSALQAAGRSGDEDGSVVHLSASFI